MGHLYDALSADDKYHLSLGRMMAAWSMAETQISFIAVILHRYGRGQQFEKQLPRAFSRKIAMIRRCVSVDPRISDFDKTISVFCDAAKLGATERNLIVHGSVFRPFSDLPPVSFRLDHFDWKDPPEEMRPVSHKQVLEVLNLACGLAITGSEIAHAFAEIFIIRQSN